MIESRQLNKPGDIFYDKGARQLWVKCLDQWAQITDIAVPMKKPCSLEQFVNGYHLGEPGSRFLLPHEFVHKTTP